MKRFILNTATTLKNSSSRIALCLGLAALSGLLLSICFPGMGSTGGLVWIWAFPLFLSLFILKGKKRGRKGFAIGYFSGLVFWLLTLQWLFATRELSFVPAANAALAWIALSAYLATYFGIFCAIVAKWGNPWMEPKAKQHVSRIEAKIAAKQKELAKEKKLTQSFRESIASLRFAFMHASLWAILEWVRSWMITGFTWNGLGAAFYDTPVFAQSAELVGVVALSFLPMFVGSVIFQVITRMVKEAVDGRMKPHWDLAVAGLMAALCFGFGVSRMAYLNEAPSKEVGILLVQQNQPLDEKHAEGSQVSNMLAYQSMSEEGLLKVEEINKKNWQDALKNNDQSNKTIEKVDLIMWPESAILEGLIYTKDSGSSDPDLVAVEGAAVINTTNLGDHYLITGANEFHFKTMKDFHYRSADNKSYNSIAVFKDNGDDPSLPIVDVYQKNHLVMFGEYIPLRETFPFLADLMGGGAIGPNFLSGEDTEPLTIQHQGEDLQLIGSVCFEDTVGRLTRKSARQAHQIIVNTTNDGWFGHSAESQQHLANALFRCIEIRRPMARAANTGVSCIINVKGSIKLADGGENSIRDENGSYFTKGTLYAKARVLTDGPMTLYALAGDWFIAICGALFVFTMISTLKKRAI